MNNWWFTADNHFGHPAIIRHCNRPWKTAALMDEAMIEIWNQYVKPADTVVVLGDFSWDINMNAVLHMATKLHGQKIFVKGNHDRWFKKEKRYMYNKKIDGIRCWCCHYPLASWPSGINLHGHCHGKLAPHVNRFDVGVDTNPEYRPYHFDEVKKWIDYETLEMRHRQEDGRYT